MKKTELRRKTPLRAGKGMVRKAWIVPERVRSAPHRSPKPQRRRPVGSSIPDKVRKALALRSGGACEVQAPGCDGWAVDPSHRKGTGAGGRKGAAAVRHHVLSNLLHACRGCHSGIHAMPAVAYWKGWMLREGEDPHEVPALYRGNWVLLDDSGAVTPTTRTTAEVDR